MGRLLQSGRIKVFWKSAPKWEKGAESYILHTPVARPDADYTKIRIVYDTSARAQNDAPSLNECLEIGPCGNECIVSQ